MKDFALLVAWVLAIAGGLLMAAGAIHTFWNMAKSPMPLLNPLGAIMIVGGVLVLGAGVAIISSPKYAEK